MLGGSGGALDALALEAAEMGVARVKRIAVSVAAHTAGLAAVGPGSALSKMCASAYPTIPSRSLEDFVTIRGVASWVTRFASGAR